MFIKPNCSLFNRYQKGAWDVVAEVKPSLIFYQCFRRIIFARHAVKFLRDNLPRFKDISIKKVIQNNENDLVKKISNRNDPPQDITEEEKAKRISKLINDKGNHISLYVPIETRDNHAELELHEDRCWDFIKSIPNFRKEMIDLLFLSCVEFELNSKWFCHIRIHPKTFNDYHLDKDYVENNHMCYYFMNNLELLSMFLEHCHYLLDCDEMDEFDSIYGQNTNVKYFDDSVEYGDEAGKFMCHYCTLDKNISSNELEYDKVKQKFFCKKCGTKLPCSVEQYEGFVERQKKHLDNTNVED